jgi:single-stranded DNA-binding protein
MNSFRLTAVGNLARNPELSANGAITCARFCLVGHDRTGIDEATEGAPACAVTRVWFIAFGEIAAEIARNSRKGDQLILEAMIVAHDWWENNKKQQGHSFIVTGFRFGAKRHPGPASPAAACHGPLPHKPQTGAAAADIEPPAQAAKEGITA